MFYQNQTLLHECFNIICAIASYKTQQCISLLSIPYKNKKRYISLSIDEKGQVLKEIT